MKKVLIVFTFLAISNIGYAQTSFFPKSSCEKNIDTYKQRVASLELKVSSLERQIKELNGTVSFEDCKKFLGRQTELEKQIDAISRNSRSSISLSVKKTLTIQLDKLIATNYKCLIK